MSAPLPELLAEIAEVAGLPAALAICDARGGQRVYFPARAPDGHWLVELVGRETADVLCAHFRSTARGGIELLVPMGPQKRIRFEAAVRAGHSVPRAAAMAGVHVRHARRWQASPQTRPEPKATCQLGLFD
jgi:hypothetical protein